MNTREETIFKTFQEHGARLVDAHGVLTGTKARVPPDTVIMFLTEPGYCILTRAVRRVSSNFFETKRGLEDFFRSGGDRRNYKHVSDILKRTHFAGQEYLDMFLDFKDPTNKTIGFIKKLPLTRRQLIYDHLHNKGSEPTYAETVGPSVQGQMLKLSTILKRRGPGVYVITSCRVSPHVKRNLPMNTPHSSSWPFVKPVSRPRSGVISKLIKSIPKSLPKPGVSRILRLKHPEDRNYRVLSEMGSLKKYALNNRIRNALIHMSRENPVNLKDLATVSKNATIYPASFNNVKKYIAHLPATTNLKNFQFTLGILSNKSKIGYVFNKLPWRKKLEFITRPTQRAHIIYTFLP